MFSQVHDGGIGETAEACSVDLDQSGFPKFRDLWISLAFFGSPCVAICSILLTSVNTVAFALLSIQAFGFFCFLQVTRCAYSSNGMFFAAGTSEAVRKICVHGIFAQDHMPWVSLGTIELIEPQHS